MTSAQVHSVPPAGRKPRRLGLYIPWGLALALVIGWSVTWVWMIGETGRRLDAAAAGMRAAGWQVSWSERTLSGYPFRLDVDFAGLTLKDPSGWAVNLRRAAGEAVRCARCGRVLSGLVRPSEWIPPRHERRRRAARPPRAGPS